MSRNIPTNTNCDIANNIPEYALIFGDSQGHFDVDVANLRYDKINSRLELEKLTVNSSVNLGGTNGITYTPGSDVDVDLITVNVTGTPRFWWNEASDSFEMNKSLTLPGGSLKIGNYTIHQDEVDGDGLTKTGSFHIQSNAGVAGNICFHIGAEPNVSGHGDGHRIWVDASHNLKWQNHLGVSVDIMSETDPVFLSQKGVNNGVATLDSGGKIPVAQLPSSLMDYKGVWDASTNIPILADGTGDVGDVHICSVAGIQNLGSGNITFAAGDWVIYNGTIWEKSINSNAVVSVNGQTSIVSLDLDDINNGITYGRATLAQITNWDTSYGWGNHAGLYDTTGTASGLMSTHESTYNHGNYDNAYSHISSDGSSHSFINQSVTTSASPVFVALGIGVTPEEPLHVKAGQSTLMRLERDGSADVQMTFLNSSGDTWTIGHDNSRDTFIIAASDDDFATNTYFNIERGNGNIGLNVRNPATNLHMRAGQIVIDGDTENGLFTTSKYNSQGVAWSVGQPERTPSLIFNGIAQDRPEISWYRGSRTYPEFSIRQHTTNDMGAEIYSGDGTSAPTMTMAFNLGNVGIGTVNPLGKFHIAPSWDNAEGIVLTTNGTNDNTGGYLQFREREDNFYGAEFGYYGSGGSNRAYIGVRDNTTTLNEVISIIRSTGFVGINSTNPGLPLEVRLDNGQQAMFFDSTAQAEGVGGGIVFGGKYTDAGAEAMAGKIGTQKTNSTSGHVGFDMVFKTQDFEGSITERMILTSDGLCGLHVPTISSPTKPLDVWGDTRLRGNLNVDVSLIVDNQITVTNIESSGNIVAGGGSSNFRISAYINRTTGIVRSARFQTDGNHTDARGISIWAGEDTESGTNYWLEAYDGDGGILTGGLRSVAGVFDVYNASDKRLKKNIVYTKIIGKDIINRLKVRDFEWKNNPGHIVTGFIAQEVKKIYPDAVGAPDSETGMYGMSKTALIPPIVKYIQELEKRVRILERC